MIAQLTGTDGNIFAVVGKTQEYLRKANARDAAKALGIAVMNSDSYSAALALCVQALEEAGYDIA